MDRTVSDDLINSMKNGGVGIIRTKILNWISAINNADIRALPFFIMSEVHEIHVINVITHRFVLFLGG